MQARNWLLLTVMTVSAVALAAQSKPMGGGETLEDRERQAWKALARSSQFVDVPHSSYHPRCEDIHPPEALATPDPLLATPHTGAKVKVSFIIGTDGRVHSPLILESAGPTGDRHVLQTVRTWRYRPGTCNGVPTETEGNIEFSSR